MLQAVLPCLLFAPKSSKVILKGGTNVDMAPPIDYAIKVCFKLTADGQESSLVNCNETPDYKAAVFRLTTNPTLTQP